MFFGVSLQMKKRIMEMLARPERPIQRLSAASLHECMDRYDTFVLDCDGVLWSNDGRTKFEGIADSIAKLRQLGKRLLFMSNNAMYTKEAYIQKFRRMYGFETTQDEVMSVNDAVATYLRDIAKVQGKVYVMDSQVLIQSLEQASIAHVGFGPNPEPLPGDLDTGIPQMIRYNLDEEVGAVVIGMDGYFDLNKLFKAVNYLNNPNCLFLVTSKEPRATVGMRNCPRCMPLMGSILAAVETGASRQATVIGKPSPIYLECARTIHPDLAPARTVVVGDMLATDIQFAANCGVDSILFSSGFDNEQTIQEGLEKDPNMALPTYILEKFGDIGEWL